MPITTLLKRNWALLYLCGCVVVQSIIMFWRFGLHPACLLVALSAGFGITVTVRSIRRQLREPHKAS
jgi:hypothetical protein